MHTSIFILIIQEISKGITTRYINLILKKKIDLSKRWAELSYRVFLFITESRIRLIGCNRCTHVPIFFFSTLTTCYTLLICIYSPYIRHRLYDITHYTAGFFHSVTEAYNKYIRNVILFYNTSFRPKKSYLFGPKNVLRRFTGPRFLWVFFSFLFFYHENCPQMDVNREHRYKKQYWYAFFSYLLQIVCRVWSISPFLRYRLLSTIWCIRGMYVDM